VKKLMPNEITVLFKKVQHAKFEKKLNLKENGAFLDKTIITFSS
jgi:hypothetical protein